MAACKLAGSREPTHSLWFVLGWQLTVVELAAACSIGCAVHWLSMSCWLSVGLCRVLAILLLGAQQNKNLTVDLSTPAVPTLFMTAAMGCPTGGYNAPGVPR